MAVSTFFDNFPGKSNLEIIRDVVAASPDLTTLLGNAGEFLDPVFSSGVTIAFKSASLAATLVSRQLKGESVDWDVEYTRRLKLGVDTFRAYVNVWYE